MRKKTQPGGGCWSAVVVWWLLATPAWGYSFDERREMSLSGFAHSRATVALQDGLAAQRHLYAAGDLVQHRNFLTLEWRHDLKRVARDVPMVGPLFQALNFGSLDYYLNLRTEYDGVWDYGPNSMRRMMKGTRLHRPYFDDARTAVPFDGVYFTPAAKGGALDYPADTISLSNRRWLRNLRGARVRLFEWYVNVTKGPLCLRVGRQNLSWRESDSFRLLDQINPLDNGFGGFLTSLDERRIPLNMLRAQWSFGTVGFLQDLTLEGFYAIDNKTNVGNSLPTSSVNYWNSIQSGNTPIMYGRTPCGGDFMAQRGLPAYFGDPLFSYQGSGTGPRHGGECSVRGASSRSGFIV